MKRRELVEWSRPVAKPVVATVAVGVLKDEVLSEVDRVRLWEGLKEGEAGEVGEVPVLWLLWSLDNRWFWV